RPRFYSGRAALQSCRLITVSRSTLLKVRCCPGGHIYDEGAGSGAAGAGSSSPSPCYSMDLYKIEFDI
ncbi:hypothetical protein HaLaN_31272, partial [Haematococcus lacustris]